MYQTSCRRRRRVMCAALALLCGSAVWTAAAAGDEIHVKVDTRDELVVIDVDFEVAATAREVWNVLTDFEGMPKFISGVERSRVIARSGRTWRVEQKGVSSAGPLSFSYDSVREIKLTPYSEIQAHALSGSMKKMDSLTRLTAGRGTTRVNYHAESIPQTALPLGIGTSFIESRMRAQFGEMRAEILRRKAARTK
jgi:uncharacterized protein YndB with AHSA1/START domain